MAWRVRYRCSKPLLTIRTTKPSPGLALRDLGRYDEAAAALKAALALDPRSDEVRENLASVLQIQEKHSEIAALYTVWCFGVATEYAYLQVLAYRTRTGQRIAGRDLAYRAVELFPNSAYLASFLGTFLRDLGYSVDTSVAHLAVAVGKPVWMLNDFDGCWRWMAGRDDLPWYPTMRIFRQTSPLLWSDVVLRVRAELDDFQTRQKSTC